MSRRKSLFRVLSERGPLIALAVAGALTLGIVAPASAQFFLFGGPPQPPRPQRGIPGQGGGFYSPFGDIFHGAPPPSAPQQRPADFSRAPPPAKRDTVAERNVLVLGDAMADWLAYGLEDALAETPELGIIRKHKTVSGLIRYQPKGEPADWAAAAKGILASEKADVIVVMLGLSDRVPIREPVVEKKPDKPGTDGKKGKRDARKSDDRSEPARSADGKSADGKAADKPAEAAPSADSAKPADADKSVDGKSADADAPPDDEDTPAIMAPEKPSRTGGGVYEFRDPRWVELYNKKIDEMIAVLKTKGVPILWVGLPAVRGPKATSDMLFLDALYRDAAGKAGITYVDLWDGFVDESGRFMQQGPDFEGQIRRLRSYDGVFFTKAGARKLAHYVEREIRRVLSARAVPVALPSDTDSQEAPLRPGAPGPRPLAGPVVPLVASSVGGDELLGGAGTRPAAVDALAARTLVKGEPLSAPPGRADDFAWPRREVGKLEAPAGESGNVATTAPDEHAPAAAAAAPPKPKKKHAPQPQQPALGFEPGQRPRPATPRPPVAVGPSAWVPGFFR